MKNTDKSFFVLRVSGIKLQQIKPSDLASLLEHFCKLLGEDKLVFESLDSSKKYSGSAVFKVSTLPELHQKKLDNFQLNAQNRKKSLVKIENIIQNYAIDFPEIQADVLFNNTSANDEDLEVFYQVDRVQKEPEIFSQKQSFQGRLVRITDGKDITDHLSIMLANEATVNVELTKELTASLVRDFEQLWIGSSLIEFTGIAKYSYLNMYEFELKSFKAKSFQLIKNESVDDWVHQLRSFDDSGWQNFKNPEEYWLNEVRL